MCSGVVWRAVVVRVVGFVVGSAENLRQVEVNRDKEEGNCSVCDCTAHAPLKELTRECMMPSQKYTSSQQ